MISEKAAFFQSLPLSARIKIDLMFSGIRYSEALGSAADHALPNYYPYRFSASEKNPTGRKTARIPYMMVLEDGTHVRIKSNGNSPWVVNGSLEQGYALHHDDNRHNAIAFEPLPKWMTWQSSDGLPLAQAGVSLHGDMAVINVAPGCQYFLADKQKGRSMRCTFCTYGAPNLRNARLDQSLSEVALPEPTYQRMQEALRAALDECTIRHIYLVGGSMTDWHQEGERFIALARRVQEVVDRRVPVTCGSGALPEECLHTLRADDLVQSICFNLEVWSEPLFAKVCPGKNRYVGYHRWISALEQAVGLWGRERVYSAMVAGVELEPEHGLTWQAAADLAVEGAEDLCRRDIIPIYSLYWPVGGRDNPDYLQNLMTYFERMNMGYLAVRERYGLNIWDGFMCHQCAYMQLECDIDRALASAEQDT